MERVRGLKQRRDQKEETALGGPVDERFGQPTEGIVSFLHGRRTGQHVLMWLLVHGARNIAYARACMEG